MLNWGAVSWALILNYKLVAITWDLKWLKCCNHFWHSHFHFSHIMHINMLVLMLDPHFKNLQIIPDFVGLEWIVKIVVEYDYRVLLLALLIAYNRLTLTLIRVEVASHVLLILGVFGSLVLIEGTTMGFLKAK